MGEKFTPGPWEVSTVSTDESVSIWARGRACIAEAYGPPRYDNARLIAAAPELFEALALFLSPYDGFEGVELAKRCDRATEDRVIIGRRALAKADGQADASPPGSEETK